MGLLPLYRLNLNVKCQMSVFRISLRSKLRRRYKYKSKRKKKKTKFVKVKARKLFLTLCPCTAMINTSNKNSYKSTTRSFSVFAGVY